MLRTVCLSVLLVSALSGVSYAQYGAPGMCQDCYPAAPPPVVTAPAPELAHTFGVGLHVTSLAIADEANPEEPIELGGGGIQIRYRTSARWEFQLALDSLRQRDEDGMPIGPELRSVTLGAMYHLRPLRRWDVYLLAAIGGIAERTETTRTSAGREEGRGQVHLGIGLERRWNRLGLSAELRGVGIAPPEGGNQPMTTTTPRPGSTTTAVIESEPDEAALFTLAATYFF